MDSKSLAQLISIVISIVIMWRLFEKAGEEGWKSIIPIYNIFIVFKITWGSGWKFLFLLIPIFNIYVIIKTCINTARAFGKGGWFAAGLFFLSPIFGLILAFSDCQYLGVPSKVSKQVEYANAAGTSDANNYTNNSQTTYTHEPEQTNTTSSYSGEGSSNNFVNNKTATNPAESAAPVKERKICPNCGFPVPDDVKYCPGCGTKL